MGGWIVWMFVLEGYFGEFLFWDYYYVGLVVGVLGVGVGYMVGWCKNDI